LESSDTVSEFQTALDELNNMAQKTAHLSQALEFSNFISLIKASHISLKSNTYRETISNHPQLPTMDHTNCTLSKWYETEGKELFGNTKQYKEIYKPHKMVHEYAEKSIQEVIDSGISRESMGNLIDNFTAMEEASQKLFSLLDDMVKEKFSERVTS
jgi:hypothetical protein